MSKTLSGGLRVLAQKFAMSLLSYIFKSGCAVSLSFTVTQPNCSVQTDVSKDVSTKQICIG
jgi:hypothetical protein